MRRSASLAVAMAVALSLICSSASATTVTVGSPLTGSFKALLFCGPVCISANTKLPEPGASVSAPVDGTITRWRVIQASGSAFRLRILHPDGSGSYTLAGSSAFETPAGLGVETFSTSLPIKAGDLIGIENLSTAGKLGFAFPAGSAYGPWFGTFPEGSSTASASSAYSYENEEVGFNADLEYGSAVVPAPPDPIVQCVVPNLTGKKLKAAKRKLKAANCGLGKVTKREGATAATGKVRKQSPKAGRVLASGSKVKVTLKP